MGNTETDHCIHYNNSNEKYFVANQISDKTMDYLRYFTNDMIEHEADPLLHTKKNIGRACSSTRNCQLEKEACSIRTYFYTYICEVLCQNFTDSTH